MLIGNFEVRQVVNEPVDFDDPIEAQMIFV